MSVETINAKSPRIHEIKKEAHQVENTIKILATRVTTQLCASHQLYQLPVWLSHSHLWFWRGGRAPRTLHQNLFQGSFWAQATGSNPERFQVPPLRGRWDHHTKVTDFDSYSRTRNMNVCAFHFQALYSGPPKKMLMVYPRRAHPNQRCADTGHWLKKCLIFIC